MAGSGRRRGAVPQLPKPRPRHLLRDAARRGARSPGVRNASGCLPRRGSSAACPAPLGAAAAPRGQAGPGGGAEGQRRGSAGPALPSGRAAGPAAGGVAERGAQARGARACALSGGEPDLIGSRG